MTGEFDSEPTLSQPAPKLVFVGRYALLDEHVLPANTDRPKLTVDKAKLQRIADNNNKRVQDTGDRTPLVIGHTDDDGKEKEQPEIVGFCDRFSTQPFFDTGRYAIWADFYIYEHKIALARNYPRRSVELWATREEIDPVSLLGATTPERDLGLMQFNRSTEIPYIYSITEDKFKMASEKKDDEKPVKKDEDKAVDKKDKDSEKPDKEAAKKQVSDTESQATEAMVAAVMQSSPMQQVMQSIQKIMQILDTIEQEDSHQEEPQAQPPNSQPPTQEQPATQEAAKDNEPPPVKFESSAPSSSNTFTPNTDKYSRKEESSKMPEVKDESDILVRLSRLENENKQLKAKAEENAIQYRKDNAKLLMDKLDAEDYVFHNKEQELQLMEELSLEAQKVHYERIKNNYKQEKKGPDSEGVSNVLKFSRDGVGQGKGVKSFEEAAEIAAKAQKEGISYADACAKIYGTK